MTGRPRRGAAPRETPVSATVSRSPSGSPVDNKKSLRLTVKAPASKLREATSQSASDELPRTARAGRPKKPIIDESEMDEDDDDEDEEEDEEEEGEDEDGDGDEDDEDAEGEEEEDQMEVDADGDDEDEDSDPVSAARGPARPIISHTGSLSHPKVTVTPAPARHAAVPVEVKEARLAGLSAMSPSATATSDDELSELDDEDGEGEDEELDGEGEEEDAEGEELEDDEELGSDEDDETGAGTPDISKMTKRQRERVAGGIDDGAFLQLPMEPQIKKVLTAEEHAMRRAEMARRRKNLSEKRNEEEKRDTINRLLKKQAPKRRGKVSRREEADGDGEEMEIEREEKADKMFTRTVIDRDGVRIAFPDEWKDKSAAGVASPGPWSNMVRVVEQ